MLDRALHIRARGLAAEHFGDDFCPVSAANVSGVTTLAALPGHDHLHIDAFLLEPAHQLGGFVSRYASANTSATRMDAAARYSLRRFPSSISRASRQLIFEDARA